jgi:glycosyltransferase involved in cell wall biosynthesis
VRDPRIRAITLPENRGLAAALNHGFADARGRYLTWTSDDNLYRPHAIERMADFLDSEASVGLVYADYTEIDEAGTELRRVPALEPRRLLEGNCVGACFLYRAEVARTTGPYAEDLPLMEDFDYWLRVAQRFRLAPLAEDLYLFRRHPQSLTDRRWNEAQVAMEKALLRHLPNLRWDGRRGLARSHLMVGRLAANRGDLRTARRYVSLALRYSPPAVLRAAPLSFWVHIGVGRRGWAALRAVVRRGRPRSDVDRGGKAAR